VGLSGDFDRVFRRFRTSKTGKTLWTALGPGRRAFPHLSVGGRAIHRGHHRHPGGSPVQKPSTIGCRRVCTVADRPGGLCFRAFPSSIEFLCPASGIPQRRLFTKGPARAHALADPRRATGHRAGDLEARIVAARRFRSLPRRSGGLAALPRARLNPGRINYRPPGARVRPGSARAVAPCRPLRNDIDVVGMPMRGIKLNAAWKRENIDRLAGLRADATSWVQHGGRFLHRAAALGAVGTAMNCSPPTLKVMGSPAPRFPSACPTKVLPVLTSKARNTRSKSPTNPPRRAVEMMLVQERRAVAGKVQTGFEALGFHSRRCGPDCPLLRAFHKRPGRPPRTWRKSAERDQAGRSSGWS